MTADEAIDIRVRLDTAINAIGAALDCACQSGAPQRRLTVALIAAMQARDAFSEKEDTA